MLFSDLLLLPAMKNLPNTMLKGLNIGKKIATTLLKTSLENEKMLVTKHIFSFCFLPYPKQKP